MPSCWSVFLRDEHLLHERPVHLEDLQPVVRAVGDVDEIVVRDERRMHRVVELRRRVAGNQLRARRELVAVIRLLSVGAPGTLELARVRIEDDDAVVEVAVRDEQLVRLLVDEQARRVRRRSRVSSLPLFFPAWPICIRNLPSRVNFRIWLSSFALPESHTLSLSSTKIPCSVLNHS